MDQSVSRTTTNPDRLSRRAHWAGGEPIANLLMAHSLAQPELVSLAAGFVDYDTLPVEPTRQAFDAIWSDPQAAQAALQYGTTLGHPPLREAIIDRMVQADGQTAQQLNLSPDRVVVTAGSNQFLFLLADTILDPGDMVLCGAPSYFVFLGSLGSIGALAAGVEIDQHGLIPEALEDELARIEAAGELGRVKAIYATTYYDNPSGVTMPGKRRAALVAIAQRWSHQGKIYLIEDAAYRELRYYGDDVASLRSFDPDGDTVIHAGTFSKSYAPGIRVGWGILPPALLTPVLARKGHIDFGSPNFNQVLMATVLQEGLFEPHLRQLRDGYRRKIDAVLDAADELLDPIGVEWVRPSGGLYIWLRLPEGLDTGMSAPLFERAVREGVLYVPGECCYAAAGLGVKQNMIRLSFGMQSCQSIRQGIEALARAIGGVL